MKIENQCLAGALAAFPYEGKIVGLEPFGGGHINDTYAVCIEGYPEPRVGYVLQRINTNVFKNPTQVMENISAVTEYIHQVLADEDGDVERGVLHFLKTTGGQLAYTDVQGMPWRSYRFIEHSFCYNESPTDDIFREAGSAFGNFLRMLEGYPAHDLHETIPNFHHTPSRYQALRAAAKADTMGRAAECAAELAFAAEREKDCGFLTGMLERGELPLRVTHNDTKINNVLFDEHTGRAICVIDLDTIMPGLVAYDYGDAIRYGASTAAEDEMDLDKVHFSLPLFHAYTKGYLEAVGSTLTANERATLPLGARLMTLECGMRFLTDYLSGDTYFKTERPGQNLDRCRTQFKLVRQMEQHFDQMREAVK